MIAATDVSPPPATERGGGERPLRVLYIDGDGPFGGSSRSLYEVLSGMPKNAVEPHFVAVHGTALNFYRRVAKDLVITRGLTKLDNTRYSYYRGRRWLVLLREVLHLPFTFLALRAAKRRWQHVDVIQNAFAAKRTPQPDTAFVSKLDKLRPDTMKVGFVGNLHGRTWPAAGTARVVEDRRSGEARPA